MINTISCRSFRWQRNSKTVPWATPMIKGASLELTPLTTTLVGFFYGGKRRSIQIDYPLLHGTVACEVVSQTELFRTL